MKEQNNDELEEYSTTIKDIGSFNASGETVFHALEEIKLKVSEKLNSNFLPPLVIESAHVIKNRDFIIDLTDILRL
ncbi:hypothetical protein [Pedobacter jeongneungensis]|uniref:hypothetical protein n=1 Tax=Pedobacter jeongneungensis TaxID=947309 RepID=UPI000469646C|nr:hypothetical protein [Pedobacter jeongneungensis]